jgi:type IV pilus assembly protein PilY1
MTHVTDYGPLAALARWSRALTQGMGATGPIGAPHGRAALIAFMLGLATLGSAGATTTTVTLADQPPFTTANVPGNLALALSVEFPTAISVANLGDYADASTYYGYFDPAKCYNYVYNATTPSSSYFQPYSYGTTSSGHQCSGYWSGNFMNWATMQTIDPFRWALTGGYRSVDTTSMTILEKAWGSAQGGTNNFPYRGTTQTAGGGHNLPTSLISAVTPFTSWSGFTSAIWSNGNMMVFAQGGAYIVPAIYVSDLASVSVANSSSPLTGFRVFVRVQVCSNATSPSGQSLLESNCVGYGTATTNSGGVTTYSSYKPQGLMQTYANKIKFAAFSYLNGYGSNDQGGVLREPMTFIGPTYPQPLSTSTVTNSQAEWDPTTGIMNTNPDTYSAGLSGVSQSGVMNYLNKFGEYGQTYMTYDNVSELYYAVVRYYEHLGNVSSWSSGATSTMLDGFPAVASWNDPIAYSCQKNFILGIGDDHTWYDYNVGGSGATGSRAVPSAVSSDSFNKAATWTSSLQSLEGITNTPWWIYNQNATYYIAGLAYGIHVNDIRTDLTGAQTVSTYWMDVAEDQEVENLNPYYLATKYGGFTPTTAIPASGSGSSYNMNTALTTSQYDTTGGTVTMNGGNVHPLPDNYFVAGNAAKMVSSLTSAFTNISNAIKAYTTSFSLSKANVSASGLTSFASQYDPSSWTSTITGSTLTFSASTGAPSDSTVWLSSNTLQTQLAGTGWRTARNVITYSNGPSCGTSYAGVPFEVANLCSTQLAALNVGSLAGTYSSNTTSTQYLNFLRGDVSNQVGSSTSGSTQSLRARALLLGDVVDANLVPVGTPGASYSETYNPGYTAFTTQWSTTTPRPTMVYAAANDGMMHAFVGSTGVEQFAYVPSAVYQGPTGTPLSNGLAQLGNPNYVHHYYVDATPTVVDVDFNRTNGNTSGSPNWHSILVGGLGKGGKSYYAIDVTNPAGMSSETAAAGKVLWEFTDSTMGYSFGIPVVVKTAKYGWVVALTSGYNNSDGNGYLYLVNPANGALLQKIQTPSASSGMTQASAYIQDYSDFTADSIYVGDLNGNLWRFDLTGTPTTYSAPTLLATLADSSGTAQPVTTAPLIEIHPTTRKRYVMVGTGQLLSTSDVASSQIQTFYAIIDGTATGFITPVSTPITRSNLTAVSSVLTGVTLASVTNGWYLDLGSSGGVGYRVVVNPTAYNGVVAFSELLTSTNACSPSGTSNLYGLNYATATSVLNTSSTNSTTVAYDSYTSAITSTKFIGTVDGAELVVGTNDGSILNVPGNYTGTIATRLLNWREIPTAQ